MKKIVFSNLFALLCLLCFLAHPLFADKGSSEPIGDNSTSFYSPCRCVPPETTVEVIGHSTYTTSYSVISFACEREWYLQKCFKKFCRVKSTIKVSHFDFQTRAWVRVEFPGDEIGIRCSPLI